MKKFFLALLASATLFGESSDNSTTSPDATPQETPAQPSSTEPEMQTDSESSQESQTQEPTQENSDAQTATAPEQPASTEEIHEEILTSEQKLKRAREMFSPYYTGPIIAGSAELIGYGYGDIQPYFYGIDNFATYDSRGHSENIHDKIVFNPVIVIQSGLTHWMDMSVVPQGFGNWQHGHHSWGFGDTLFQLGFRITRESLTVPAIKFLIKELFPSGRYEKLTPGNAAVQSTGGGSYETALALYMQKTFFWSAVHPFRLRFNFSYSVPSFVRVRGFNTYGGGYGTNARVRPGNNFFIDGAFEISMSQRWVFANDILFNYANRTTFTGNPGTTSTGAVAVLGNPSNYSWSLAPALEYNWNDQLGILLGTWFTVAGRNTFNFVSGIFSINYYYAW